MWMILFFVILNGSVLIKIGKSAKKTLNFAGIAKRNLNIWAGQTKHKLFIDFRIN